MLDYRVTRSRSVDYPVEVGEHSSPTILTDLKVIDVFLKRNNSLPFLVGKVLVKLLVVEGAMQVLVVVIIVRVKVMLV